MLQSTQTNIHKDYSVDTGAKYTGFNSCFIALHKILKIMIKWLTGVTRQVTGTVHTVVTDTQVMQLQHPSYLQFIALILVQNKIFPVGHFVSSQFPLTFLYTKRTQHTQCINVNAPGTYFRKIYIWGRIVLSLSTFKRCFYSLFSPETLVFCWKPFPPFGGRCFPFNVEQRGWSVGEGGSAEGWGEAQEALSMRCDALLQLTRLNYGELWWNMRDLGRIVGRDDTAAGHISLIGEDGQRWRNGLTTAKHVLRGDKLDTNKCVCAPKESGWIPACHCTTLFCNPTDNAMLLCFFFSAWSLLWLSMIDTGGGGCKWLEHVWHLPLQTHSLALASKQCMNLAVLSQIYIHIFT